MPVKTTIEESDFKNILLSYELGDYQGFNTFANGEGQTTVLLKTSKGQYVLRYYENRDYDHVAFEVALFEYLITNNYPVPHVIKSSNGNTINIYKSKPYILLEYISGTHLSDPNKIFDKSLAPKVIEQIAQLHNLTNTTTSNQFGTKTNYDADYCLSEYKKHQRTKNASIREDWFISEVKSLKFSKDLPKGICHADVNYGNFLFEDGNVVAVLDFDMSFYTHFVYDIANLIYWWACPPHKGLQYEVTSFIITEYKKHRNISENEQKSIYDALKLLHLLGIAWSNEDEFEDGHKAVEELKAIGEREFYKITSGLKAG